MAGTIQCHNVVSCQKNRPRTLFFIFLNVQKVFKMTATCKEANDLNYPEIIMFVYIGQILSVANCETLKFFVLRNATLG